MTGVQTCALPILEQRGTAPIATGVNYAELLRRPQLSYELLAPFDPGRPELPKEVWEQAEIQIKYEGYIKKQLADVREMRRLEERPLPPALDYDQVVGLRLEAKEKLKKRRPQNIGQASRISGVSPADVSVLLIWLAGEENRRGERTEND